MKFNFISQECQAFFEYLSVTIFWGRVADSKCIIDKSILFKRTTVKKGEGSWAKTTLLSGLNMTHEAKTKLISFNWKECDWSYLFFRHFCFPLSNFQRAKHAQENCRADKIGMFWRTISLGMAWELFRLYPVTNYSFYLE